MLSSDITIALIALAAAILASTVGSVVAGKYTLRSVRETLQTQERQWAEERSLQLEQLAASDRRWRSELRLPRQLDVLNTLYTSALELHTTTQTLSRKPLAELEDSDYLPARQAYNAYSKALDIADLYLSPQESGSAFIYLTITNILIVNALLHAYSNDSPDSFSSSYDSEKQKQDAETEARTYTRLMEVLRQHLAAPEHSASPAGVP